MLFGVDWCLLKRLKFFFRCDGFANTYPLKITAVADIAEAEVQVVAIEA